MAEVSTAEKRQYLRDRGVDVGTRGKLSAEAEAEYDRLSAKDASLVHSEPYEPAVRNLEV